MRYRTDNLATSNGRSIVGSDLIHDWPKGTSLKPNHYPVVSCFMDPSLEADVGNQNCPAGNYDISMQPEHQCRRWARCVASKYPVSQTTVCKCSVRQFVLVLVFLLCLFCLCSPLLPIWARCHFSTRSLRRGMMIDRESGGLLLQQLADRDWSL